MLWTMYQRYLHEKINGAVHGIYASDRRDWTANSDVIYGISVLEDHRDKLTGSAQHQASIIFALLDKYADAGPEIADVLRRLDENERSTFLHHLWELESTLDSESRL